MPFKKGAPKPPNSGRKRGSKNIISGDVRAMVLTAVANKGGVKYFERQAAENPAAFMSLIKGCMPKDINIGAQESLADILRMCEERLAKRRSST